MRRGKPVLAHGLAPLVFHFNKWTFVFHPAGLKGDLLFHPRPAQASFLGRPFNLLGPARPVLGEALGNPRHAKRESIRLDWNPKLPRKC